MTAGPTYESIDPVRFIGNHSSGKMGYALAEELAGRGAEVTLVSGPVHLKTKHNKIALVPVTSADQMHQECMKCAADYDFAFMAAAVADYTPVEVAGQKIKKKEGEINIQLKKTPDILGSLGATKTKDQLLVGFALETQDEEQKNIIDSITELG